MFLQLLVFFVSLFYFAFDLIFMFFCIFLSLIFLFSSDPFSSYPTKGFIEYQWIAFSTFCEEWSMWETLGGGGEGRQEHTTVQWQALPPHALCFASLITYLPNVPVHWAILQAVVPHYRWLYTNVIFEWPTAEYLGTSSRTVWYMQLWNTRLVGGRACHYVFVFSSLPLFSSQYGCVLAPDLRF